MEDMMLERTVAYRAEELAAFARQFRDDGIAVPPLWLKSDMKCRGFMRRLRKLACNACSYQRR
jgi:hypothetical protein